MYVLHAYNLILQAPQKLFMAHFIKVHMSSALAASHALRSELMVPVQCNCCSPKLYICPEM